MTDDIRFDGPKPASASLHEAAGRIGALPSHIKPVADSMHVFGRALPVRCPPGDNLFIHRALADAAAGDVLVVDCGPGDDYGYWGEIMATAGIARGVAGLVITGGVRDKLALVELGLPTFSGRICIQGTGKNADLDGAVGEPVRIGAITVRRGDIVVGDADGVMILNPDVAPAFIAAAFERDAKEAQILDRVRAGELTLDVYNL